MKQWKWNGTLPSLKVLHYWILTIRLFSVISKMLIGGSLIRLQRGRPCILQPQPTDVFVKWKEIKSNTSTIKIYPCILPQKYMGWVLWHIKHWRLLNAKSTLYIFLKYITFGLFGFYCISTIVGFLIPNPLYTYILKIYNFLWFAMNCKAYSSFECVSSDHRIVTAKIRLNLRKTPHEQRPPNTMSGPFLTTEILEMNMY